MTTATNTNTNTQVKPRGQAKLPLHRLHKQFAAIDTSVMINIHHDLEAKASYASFIPAENPVYQHRLDETRMMVVFQNSSHIALKLIGPKGTGKTTLAEQFYQLIGCPLLTQNCDETMDRSNFIGSWVLTSEITQKQIDSNAVIETDKQGMASMMAKLTKAVGAQPKMKFVLGSVLTAAQNGWPVLLNEYNALNPNAALALNDLLEGKPVYVEQIGRTITPKKGFKIIATVNPESPGLYAGRHSQDTSNDDRFWAYNVDYPEFEVEQRIVSEYYVASGMDSVEAIANAKAMVEVATKVRASYMGSSNASAALEQTISTRGLVSWAELTVFFSNMTDRGISPMHYALEIAITNHCKAPESKEAIHRIATEVSGAEYVSLADADKKAKAVQTAATV
ncbi:MAG: AAA family ATPase [Methylophilus sp.]|uniref:AAA family ATPase n=1 Tax=Methylophilus sp. TaxID=29541 RepID=UPI003FA01DD3